MQPIGALIFDFDGLILDTETPEFLVWQEIYDSYGQSFDLNQWARILGGAGLTAFDPVADLQALTGQALDPSVLLAAWRRQSDERIAAQPVRPGVLDLIRSAGKEGVRLAVASSSPHAWVDGHLKRLGLWIHFERVVCVEDVQRPKPHPDLFLSALQGLGLPPDRALALEDSPNGVRAARLAGLRVVAVPNPLTGRLDLSEADLILPSLEGFSAVSLAGRVGVGG